MTATVDPCDDMFEVEFGPKEDRTPLNEKTDPLALAWAAYHVWQKFPQRRWVPFSSIEAHDHDHHMAQTTRRYYRDRLTMRVLRGQELTPIQREMLAISQGGVLRRDHLGLLYRMPYFYAEDVKRDSLSSHYTAQVSAHNTGRQAWRPAPLLEHQVQDLRPVTQILRTRKSGDVDEYWWRNSEDQPVLWSVVSTNPLRSVVDSLWRRDHVTVRAFFHHGQVRGQDFWHWYVSGVELA